MNPKMVYVSGPTHRRLKVLAAQRGVPMGDLVAQLVEREAAQASNSWLGAEAREVQDRALAEVWDDPDLDVYNDA